MNFESMAENIQELCANGASQSDLIDYLLNSFNESPLMQILTDPENQPSQYGTIPLNWYENLENKIERMRFNISEVIDSLDGSYEKHNIPIPNVSADSEQKKQENNEPVFYYFPYFPF